MRKFQIGVTGSAADLNYSEGVEKAAERIGELIAERGGVLLFGAEKDSDSLSTAACRGAKKKGGLTVGITYGKGKDVIQKDIDIVLPTGIERGGGREFVFILGCDAIIVLGGGSGTLNELSIAYMAGIPTIALKGIDGWGSKLIGESLDARNRSKVLGADTPEAVVEMAFEEATKFRTAGE